MRSDYAQLLLERDVDNPYGDPSRDALADFEEAKKLIPELERITDYQFSAFLDPWTCQDGSALGSLSIAATSKSASGGIRVSFLSDFVFSKFGGFCSYQTALKHDPLSDEMKQLAIELLESAGFTFIPASATAEPYNGAYGEGEGVAAYYTWHYRLFSVAF